MLLLYVFFFFKQKTAYEMRISDWSSDVCSSDLIFNARAGIADPQLQRGITRRRPHHPPAIAGLANGSGAHEHVDVAGERRFVLEELRYAHARPFIASDLTVAAEPAVGAIPEWRRSTQGQEHRQPGQHLVHDPDTVFMGRHLYMHMQARDNATSRYRSEEHTSELQSLMRTSYAVFCLK